MIKEIKVLAQALIDSEKTKSKQSKTHQIILKQMNQTVDETEDKLQEGLRIKKRLEQENSELRQEVLTLQD